MLCKLYTFIKVALLSLFITACANDNQLKIQSTAPNIVIIDIDDAGYSDYSAFESKIAAPNIDALLNKGYVFPEFFNNGRFSPTRASLLTGHYPQKVGVGELSSPLTETKLTGFLSFLNLDYPNLSELLKQLRYRSIMSRKWHHGGQVESRAKEQQKWPLQSGFDAFFGFIVVIKKSSHKWITDGLLDHYLFDLHTCPTERLNLASDNSNLLAEFRNTFGEYKRENNLVEFDVVERIPFLN